MLSWMNTKLQEKMNLKLQKRRRKKMDSEDNGVNELPKALTYGVTYLKRAIN